MLPIMITVMLAKWSADAFGRESIYDEHILMNEYPFLDNKWEPSFRGRADELMQAGATLHTIQLTNRNTIRSLRSFALEFAYTGFPIVTSPQEMLLVGYISRSELLDALDKGMAAGRSLDTQCVFSAPAASASSDTETEVWDVRPCMDVSPIQVSPDAPLNCVFDLFKRLGLRCSWVCVHRW
jgi:chloride channel 3/4/5